MSAQPIPQKLPRFTPNTDSKVVLKYVEPTLAVLQSFFRDACERTMAYFKERNWAMDPNLFAYEVRKDVYERLRKSGLDVLDGASPEFSIEKMSLAGLLLKLPVVHLRIRKSRDNEVPAASSDQLTRFYNWNLFAFEDVDMNGDPIPLHLVLLWNLDSNYSFAAFRLVCTAGDGGVDGQHFWEEPVSTDLVSPLGSSFKKSFEAANSDVPLSPKKPQSDDKKKTS